MVLNYDTYASKSSSICAEEFSKKIGTLKFYSYLFALIQSPLIAIFNYVFPIFNFI